LVYFIVVCTTSFRCLFEMVSVMGGVAVCINCFHYKF